MLMLQVEEGWWEGSLNGKVGVFPSNFVEMIEEGDGEQPGGGTAGEYQFPFSLLLQFVLCVVVVVDSILLCVCVYACLFSISATLIFSTICYFSRIQ